jgi:hypothetical protein
MSIEPIKAAIFGLSPEDRRALASCLYELDYDAWDKQMAQDFSPGGRGGYLLEKVKQEIASGKANLPFQLFTN